MVGVMPGIGGLMGGSAAAPKIVNTNTSAATSNPAVVAMPASIVAGNTLYCFFERTDNTSITPPAGWTQIAFDGVSGANFYLFKKTATGLEGATQNWTLGTGNSWAAITYQVEGAPNETLATFSGNGSTPDSPNVTLSGSLPTLLLIGAGSRNGALASGAPAGYGNLLTASNAFARIMSADKTADVASDNPASWPGATGLPWGAITAGLRY